MYNDFAKLWTFVKLLSKKYVTIVGKFEENPEKMITKKNMMPLREMMRKLFRRKSYENIKILQISIGNSTEIATCPFAEK